MNGLRLAPEGQGKYKNAPMPLNESFDEEVWPVNVNKLVKTTPVGDDNASERNQNLSWANKPKNKMDGGKRSRRNRKNTKRSNRRAHKRRNTRNAKY